MRSKLGKEGSVKVNNTRKKQLFSDTVKTMEFRLHKAVSSIMSLRPGTEASIDYEPCWQARFFATPYRTVQYTFSCLFIQDVSRVGHPSEA
jgi:hypothetical protein